MLKDILIPCCIVFILSGCVYNDEPLPEITQSANLTKPAPKIIKPQSTKPNWENIPNEWFPPRRLEKKWTAIIIHHSATDNGNVAIFDKYHKEQKHWQGIGYDFVIGNGTNTPDGKVEVTPRWQQQETGAHCGGTPGNWANRDGIGICLVGDFNKTVPTPNQMWALKKLVRFLQHRYKIPTSCVYGHRTTPGARKTDCPGKNFPMATLKSQL